MWFDARGGDVNADKPRRARRTGSAQSCPSSTRSLPRGECRPAGRPGVLSGRCCLRRLRRLKVFGGAEEVLGRGAGLRHGCVCVRLAVRLGEGGAPLLLARRLPVLDDRAVLPGRAPQCFVDSAHHESPLLSQLRKARPTSSASGAASAVAAAPPSSSRSTSRSWLTCAARPTTFGGGCSSERRSPRSALPASAAHSSERPAAVKMRAAPARSSPVCRPRCAFGRRSKVSATSSTMSRPTDSAPAAKPASRELSQMLLIWRGIPSEQRKTRSTAAGVKMSVRSAPAASSREAM